MSRCATEALVIGWGNELRGDDAAGLQVAVRIAAEGLPDVRVETARLLTPELADELARCEVAVLIDADAEADEVTVREVAPSDAPRGVATHGLSAEQLAGLCETAYGVRPRTWLVGVPARQFELGDAVSDRTRKAIERAVKVVRDLLDEVQRSRR